MKNPQQSQVKHSKQIVVILAAICALSFIAISARIPVETTLAHIEDDQGLFVAIGAGAVTGAILASWFDGPGVGVGALIGGAAGLFGYLIGQSSNGQSNISETAQKTYAVGNAITFHNLQNLSDSNAANMNVAFPAQANWFARCAESAAYDLWYYQAYHKYDTDGNVVTGGSPTGIHLPFIYNASWVLSRSSVYNGSQSMLYAAEGGYNAVLSSYDTFAANFVGTYNGMSWGFVPGVGSAHATGTNAIFYRYLCQFANTAGSGYYVINPACHLYVANAFTSTKTYTLTLTAYGSSSPTFNDTFTLAANVVHDVNLSEAGVSLDKYVIDLKTGSAHDGIVFGLGSPAEISPGTITPDLVCFQPASWPTNTTLLYRWSVYYTGGGTAKWFFPDSTGLNHQSNSVVPKFEICSSTDTFGSSCAANQTAIITGSTAIPGACSQLNSMITAIGQMYQTANTFGLTAYNIVKNGGGSPVIPHPSIIFPLPDQVKGLSWQAAYAIYLAYLEQLSAWYLTHDNMTVSDVNISASSLMTFAVGKIVKVDGSILADNTTVFMPFVDTASYYLHTGGGYTVAANVMNQSAFVICWGNDSNAGHGSVYASTHLNLTTDNWTTGRCTYIQLASGDTIYPMQIEYNGTIVSGVWLNVTKLNYVVANISTPGPGTQLETPYQWLMGHLTGFIITAVGAICLIAAAWMRSASLIMFGLALVAVGIFWILSDAGYFSGFNWNPFFAIRPQVSMWWWN